MSQELKRRRGATSILLLLALTYGLFRTVRWQPPSLLRSAVCLSPRPLPSSPYRFWNRNILLGNLQNIPGTATYRTILRHYDVLTGKQSPLVRLSQVVDRSGAGDHFGFVQTTSDGKFLLWPTDKLTAISADFNGAHAVQWNCGDLREINWLPDNRHWFGLMIDASYRFTAARIYDRQDAKNVVVLPNIRPEESESLNFLCAPSPNRFLSSSFPGTYSGENDYGSIPKIVITQWTFTTVMAPTAHYTLSVPAASKIVQIEASPDGKRLFLVLLRQHELPVARFAHRLWHGFPASVRYSVDLEVYNINGQDRKLVGMESEREPDKQADEQASEQVHDFSWAPDNRHILFWHKDRLWTVLAD